jgi:hypothetical protein
VEANVHKVIVLTEWAGFERGGFDGCHGCGAGIGGGIFANVGGSWVVETKNISNTVDTIGSWGHAPDGQLIRIGPNKYGFLFFDYFGGQGYSASMMHVYANIAGELKPIITIPEFDEVMPYIIDDWLTLGHQSIYRFVPGNNPTYYDLQVSLAGLQPDELYENLIPRDEKKRYTFNGSNYILQETPTPSPSQTPKRTKVPTPTRTPPHPR